MSLLGRPLDATVIVDNSPSCYLFHPENAIPCTSWFSDVQDTELFELVPVLKAIAAEKDVRRAIEDLAGRDDSPLVATPKLALDAA